MGTLIASIFCSGAGYALFCWDIGQIWMIFGTNSATKPKKFDAVVAPSSDAIWEEFSEQH